MMMHRKKSQSRTMSVRFVASMVGVAALATLGTGTMIARAATPVTTYYGCVKAGLLTKVGVTAPTCVAPATMISWDSRGPTGATGPQGVQGPQGPAGVAAPPALPTVVNRVTGAVAMVPGQTVRVATAPITLAQSGHIVVQASTFFVLPQSSTYDRWDDVRCQISVDGSAITSSEALLFSFHYARPGRVPMSVYGASATYAAGTHTAAVDCVQYYGTDTDVQASTSSLTAIATQ
jgi:hypothetical protein